jgi:hypothetical protein
MQHLVIGPLVAGVDPARFRAEADAGDDVGRSQWQLLGSYFTTT